MKENIKSVIRGKLPVPAIALTLLALSIPVHAVSFTDVTETSGVGDSGHGIGAAYADVDGDGDPDLYVSNQDGENTLYINDGNGVFTPAPPGAAGGPGDDGMTMGSVFGDIDNDGDQDLFVVRRGRYEIETNRLLVNENGLFADRTREAGLGSSAFTYCAALADVDNDGYLDLYLANRGVGAGNTLYHNNGNGTFTDITDEAGVGGHSWSWGAVFTDFNSDGYQDLYVVNGRYPGGEANHLFMNERDGTFRDASRISGTSDENWSIAAATADVDNDGDFDIFVSNFSGPNKLFLNDGTGMFKDVSKVSGLSGTGWSTGPAFGDVDHDGDLDLYVGDGKNDNRLYMNDGTGSFRHAADEVPAAMNGDIRTKGTVFTDIDNDGDLDLYVVNWGAANRLYRNDLNDNRFLVVRLSARISNADSVGARVVLSRSGRLIGVREITSLSGLCTQGSKDLHFGLPGAGDYRVDVTFPSGLEVSGTHESGQVVNVTEPE